MTLAMMMDVALVMHSSQGSVSHQLLAIGMHYQLSMEQIRYVFKQTHSFA